MTWDITNNLYDDIHIKFNNGVAITYVPKFRIYMTVTEPYLYLYWTDTELGGAGLTRMLQIDFNDVSSLPVSAAALKTLIEGYIVSEFGSASVAASVSNGSFTFNTLSFGDLNGLSFYSSGGSIVGSYTVPAGGSPIFSAGTASANLGSIVFSNSNGVSFGLNGSTVTASHNGITSQTVQPAIGLNTAGTNITWTANSSGISIDAGAYLTTQTVQPAVGLNTAQTNVTWTVNSSGISLNASGYAGIGTSATNASITLNSNGLAISVAAPGGGVTPAISGSNGSFSYSTVTFGNLNGASFYTSNGSMVMSYTVPVAGGSPNFSAGTTSNNLGSVVFSNANGVSFGLNGSTITASVNAAGGGVAMSRYPEVISPFVFSTANSGTTGTTGGSTQISGVAYVASYPIAHDIHFYDLIRHIAPGVTVGGTGSGTYGHVLGIYTLEANTRLSLLSTFQAVHFMSQNSTSAQSHHWYWGTNSTSNSSAVNGNVSASFTGSRWHYYNQSEQTLAAGNYHIAYMHTAATAGSFVYNQSNHGVVSLTQSGIYQIGQATVRVAEISGFQGIFTASTNTNSIGFPLMPATVHTSKISNSLNVSQVRIPVFLMQRYTSS